MANFKTSNLDLAAFLLLKGEVFTSLEAHPLKGHVIEIHFEDKDGKCFGLESSFINSEFRTYREYHRFLLKQIHEKLQR